MASNYVCRLAGFCTKSIVSGGELLSKIIHPHLNTQVQPTKFTNPQLRHRLHGQIHLFTSLLVHFIKFSWLKSLMLCVDCMKQSISQIMRAPLAKIFANVK